MPDAHFPRLAELPPYILAAVDEKKDELRASGVEVFDFGLGNPDRASPPAAVEELRRTAAETTLHRYQPSPGHLALRAQVCAWYQRRHGVTLDPLTEVVVTLGSKEGLAHLALATLGPGDVVLAPDPCYPAHRFGPQFAGATVVPVPTGPGRDALADLEAAAASAPRPPKLAIVNFPHNPTTATIDAATMKAIVRWAERRDLWLVSDIAYADLDLAPDGPGRVGPPSALAVDGARARTVEFFTLSKSYNMPGWRVGFCVGNARLVGALRRIKGYLDYGLFGPVQRAAALVLAPEHDAFVDDVRRTYRERARLLVDGMGRAGWPVEMPAATMFVWAPLPERWRHLGSVAFALKLLEEAHVAVAPGVAFGAGGEGYVRLALVEEADRITRACEAIGVALAIAS